MTEQNLAARLAIPPPLDLNLFDGVRIVGWLTPETIGFRGFANEAEAMHAARVVVRVGA